MREYKEHLLDVTRNVIVNVTEHISNDIDCMLILVEGCDKGNPISVLATMEELESRMQSLRNKL